VIKILVRGTAPEALTACLDRAVLVENLQEFDRYTSGEVPNDNLLQLVEWMGEWSEAPYSPGTLLLFSQERPRSWR
jgi:hypothetical protein